MSDVIIGGGICCILLCVVVVVIIVVITKTKTTSTSSPAPSSSPIAAGALANVTPSSPSVIPISAPTTSPSSGGSSGSGTGTPIAPAPASNNLACLSSLGTYTQWAPSFTSSFNVNSLTDATNQTNLANFCAAGTQLLTGGCNASLVGSVQPLNNDGFRNLCCNGSTNVANCNSTASNCILNKAQFDTQAYSLSNFNDAALNNASNLASLSNFCTVGNQIIAGGCSIDANYPLNNSVFTKYCCKGSNQASACSAGNATCLQDTGNFLTWDYNFQNLNPSSIQANLGQVTSYCSNGVEMLNNSCTNIANPINSATFRNLCCNGSTNSSNCNANSVQCSANVSNFSNSAYNLQGLLTNPSSISANIGAVTAFCTLGQSLITNCNSVLPHNTTAYTTLCT